MLHAAFCSCSYGAKFKFLYSDNILFHSEKYFHIQKKHDFIKRNIFMYSEECFAFRETFVFKETFTVKCFNIQRKFLYLEKMFIFRGNV